ncbi:hypothetical protein HZS_7800 [Henneguya salminicola]|nr:hypothetical protein HZS_7800 [Henneguya salminicola]
MENSMRIYTLTHQNLFYKTHKNKTKCVLLGKIYYFTKRTNMKLRNHNINKIYIYTGLKKELVY